MSAMAFDTLKTAKSLEAAGFTPAQAEAVASTFGSAFTETAATRSDVEGLGRALRSDMDKLGTELRGEMTTIEARLGGRVDKVEARLDSLEWMMRHVMSGVATLVVGMIVAFIRGAGGA